MEAVFTAATGAVLAMMPASATIRGNAVVNFSAENNAPERPWEI